MSGTVAQDWSAAQERSNHLAMRTMAWIAVRLGRPVARLVLHPITLYYLVLAAGPRRQSARYLQRVLGRKPSWRERYRHFHTFAATVLDRLYFVQDQVERFDVTMTRESQVHAALDEGRGVLTMGAHIGSFEALHTVSTHRPGLRVAMVMFPDNARVLHGVLRALAPDFELDIIAIGRPGSTLAIRDWLDGGGLVGVLADRFLPAEQERGKLVWLPLLGKPAPFPDGPFRLAMLLKRRVIMMVGLYHGGARYEVRFDTLADFRDPPVDAAAREALLHSTMAAYAAYLEGLMRELPYNWFNFHDFWCEDAAPA